MTIASAAVDRPAALSASETIRHDWSRPEIRSLFELAFPEDYKQFIHTYGNVIWCDLFRPVYPDTSSGLDHRFGQSPEGSSHGLRRFSG